MAMTSGGGRGSSSYSYTTTVSYTLDEALQGAAQGSLEPLQVYAQLPVPLKAIADELATRGGGKPFTSAPSSEQRAAMGALREHIHRANAGQSRRLSLLEAIREAASGTVDGVAVFRASPPELQAILDAIAKNSGSKGFCEATSATRATALATLLGMLSQQNGASTNADDAGTAQRAAGPAPHVFQSVAAPPQARTTASPNNAPSMNSQETSSNMNRNAGKPERGTDFQELTGTTVQRETVASARRLKNQCRVCGRPISLFIRLFSGRTHSRCRTAS